MPARFALPFRVPPGRFHCQFMGEIAPSRIEIQKRAILVEQDRPDCDMRCTDRPAVTEGL